MILVKFKKPLKIDFKDVAKSLGPWCWPRRVDERNERVITVIEEKTVTLFDLRRTEEGYTGIGSYNAAAILDEII